MNTKLVSLLCVACVWVAVPASGAIKYSFQQRSRSDVQEMPSNDMNGSAIIDADQTRVDFNGKTGYGEKSYVISSSTTKRMYVVNETKKVITEYNMANVANALAATKIDITNMKSDLKKLSDHMEIAGLPTDHYRLETSYDMTVMFGEMALTQRVQTIVEKWTTSAFGDVNDILAANLFKTGNMQLDQLIDSETTKMKGLPLRQLISVITGPSDLARSKARSTPTHKQTGELLVTEVKIVPSDASLFTLPVGYTRIDGSSANEESLHNLSLQ